MGNKLTRQDLLDCFTQGLHAYAPGAHLTIKEWHRIALRFFPFTTVTSSENLLKTLDALGDVEHVKGEGVQIPTPAEESPGAAPVGVEAQDTLPHPPTPTTP